MDLPGSPPLGATRHPTYEELHRTRSSPAAPLVLYTNGPVERAGEPLEAGLERLRAVVRREWSGIFDHLGDAMVSALLHPGDPAEDDAALLLARALPLSDSLVSGVARRSGVRSR